MPAIPRKLAFRILSELLEGHSIAIETRTVDSIRRRGAQAVEGAIRKESDRAVESAKWQKQSRELASWTGRDDRCKGADVAPELLGWLCALAVGHTYARPEIIRLARSMDGVDWHDLPSVVWCAIQL